MAKVKYLTSPDELPAGQNYVLVMYGKEYANETPSWPYHHGGPPRVKDRK